MKLGIIVNVMDSGEAGATTYRLAAEAINQGHEVWVMSTGNLVEDAMFLVGLDIVGDKLMEIHVFSPGGLGSAQKSEKVDFTRAVLESLERKVRYMQYYRRNFSNVELATL